MPVGSRPRRCRTMRFNTGTSSSTTLSMIAWSVAVMVFVPNSARISGSRAAMRSARHALDETVTARRPGMRLRGDMGIDGYSRIVGYEAGGFNTGARGLSV